MAEFVLMSPSQLDAETAPPLSEFGFRFLAEGDSWFSIGALNPFKSANLLQELSLTQRSVAVSCALPGDTLKRMVDTRRDPQFVSLLAGARARIWDGILISAGGNDLIDALQAPVRDADGSPVPPAKRLLLAAAEWGPASLGAARYLSDDGWATFSTYLGANFEAMLQLRDRGPSRGAPVFIHGYAVPTPRPSGASRHIGPWLLPSIEAYAIPEADRPALAELLIERLAALLGGMAADRTRFPNLHFFDSTRVPLERASAGATGESGDWVNEIHLTRAGCRKVARAWSAAIEQVLAP